MNQSRDDGFTPTAARRSWRGQAAQGVPVARHRWQRDWTALPAQRGRLAAHWQRLRLFTLLIAFGALFALLAYLLLQSPRQTPFLAVAVTQYESPWPLNAFAAEDLQSLQTLHRKSLQFVNASNEWSTVERARESLRQHLDKLNANAAKGHALVIYFSVVGVVDEAGRPCLVLPDSKALDSATWLPVADIIAAAREGATSDRPLLLVLDCARETSLPAAGIVENEFAKRLESLLRAEQSAPIALLVANQTGDRAWTAPHLGKSTFGHFFQRGLAGEADYVSSGGDGNRRVSVHELQHYLLTHVDAWAVQQRGGHQRPELVNGSDDFDIAWVIRNGHLSGAPSAPTVSEENLAKLWRQRDSLLHVHLERVDPVAWHDLQRRLLRLAEMSHAGQAYAAAAQRSYEQLRKQLDQLTQQREALERLGSDLAWRQTLAGESWFPMRDARVHSLPLMRTYQKAELAALNDAEARLTEVVKNPTAEKVAKLLSADTHKPLAATNEIHSLRLYHRYVPAARSGQLAKVLNGRLQGEKAAVPQDIRSLAWLQSHLNAADQQRRQAEDALFASDEAASIVEADNATNGYLAAQTAAAELADAWRVCDTVAAELIPWSVWIGQPRGDATAISAGDDLPKQIELLAREHQLLVSQLADTSGHADSLQRIGTLQQTAERVSRMAKSIETVRLAACQRVLQEQDEKQWPACSAEIEFLLALSSITADQRKELLDRHETLTSALARQRVRVDRTAGKPRGEDNAAAGELVPLARVARVLMESSMSADDRTLASTGLRDLWRQIDRQAGEGKNITTILEYEARIAIAAGVPLESDIVAQQRRADWQSALLWHARRALDDFLGPLNETSEPLFAIAAEDYASLARIARPEMTETARKRFAEVTDLLEQRRSAATEGLRITAQNSLVLFNDQGSRTEIALVGNESAPLPPGRVAIAAEAMSGEAIQATIRRTSDDSPVQGIATPLGMDPVSLSLLGQSLSGDQALLRVIAHQRGNAFTTPLVIRAASGPSVRIEPTASNQSRITVSGGQRKRPAVIFVLDCSKSMESPVTVEASDGRTISKLKAAKSALQTMLNQLARDGDAQVGVKLVGHRMGWTTREPLRVARQTGYGRPIPDAVSPHNDVESALTLGRFDALAAGEVSSLLKSVIPWGQSPLYLGVMESLDEMTGADDDADANVVVITDGVNYQFLPSSTDMVPASSTQTVDDVLRAAKGKSVRVHVVGFGVSRDEAATAEEQFNRIATATNGTYQPIDDVSRIIPHLESLLGPSAWSVASNQPVSDRKSDKAPTSELGQSHVVDVVPGEANEFNVTFRNAREKLLLRGGESVELRVSTSGQRLDAEPYPGVAPALVQLVTGENKRNTGFLLAVDRPIKTNKGVQLAVSLRHQDDRFVPRPAEIWIEATPRSSEGSALGSTHVFYDTVFVDGETSPVVRWTPGNWPAQAASVEIRCWVQPLAIEPAVSTSVATSAAKRSPMTDPALSEHSWFVEVEPRRAGQDTFEVRVANWDRAADVGFPTLKVNVRPQIVGVAARAIERVFDADNRVTAHRFTFDSKEISPEELQLELTTREAITTDAWRTGEPVIVNIDAGLELVPPARLSP